MEGDTLLRTGNDDRPPFPRGHKVAIAVVGELLGLGRAVCAHDIHLGIAIAVRGKRNAIAVTRPHRPIISLLVIGDARWAGAVRIHHIDLKVAITVGVESKLAAIW